MMPPNASASEAVLYTCRKRRLNLSRLGSVYPPRRVHNTRTMAAILPLRLPDHLPTLLISTVGFAAIHHLGAPEFARFLLGKKGWDALGSRDRVGWCVFPSRHHHHHQAVISLSWIYSLLLSCAGLLVEEGADACTD